MKAESFFAKKKISKPRQPTSKVVSKIKQQPLSEKGVMQVNEFITEDKSTKKKERGFVSRFPSSLTTQKKKPRQVVATKQPASFVNKKWNDDAKVAKEK